MHHKRVISTSCADRDELQNTRQNCSYRRIQPECSLIVWPKKVWSKNITIRWPSDGWVGFPKVEGGIKVWRRARESGTAASAFGGAVAEHSSFKRLSCCRYDDGLERFANGPEAHGCRPPPISAPLWKFSFCLIARVRLFRCACSNRWFDG
jgi:hypothetical protein